MIIRIKNIPRMVDDNLNIIKKDIGYAVHIINTSYNLLGVI